MFLEETGEVLGVFEAEGVGGLGGGEPTDQQALGATDKEALDDLCGTLARNTSHHIAEIAGRQAEFGGAIFHVRQTVLPLQTSRVIVGEYSLESRLQVVLSLGGILKLTLIE